MTKCIKRILIFLSMRYINLHFTYLLTYLHQDLILYLQFWRYNSYYKFSHSWLELFLTAVTALWL